MLNQVHAQGKKAITKIYTTHLSKFIYPNESYALLFNQNIGYIVCHYYEFQYYGGYVAIYFSFHCTNLVL